ncbi:GGDEF domain-containing protein [Paraburkholderia bannensis]|nr:sensor domain-containing diguanylate cyclase [Paraburkholderia bannensis]RQM44271.1 GGDEF domain-containing protein [Paraburkholderia bannensis]
MTALTSIEKISDWAGRNYLVVGAVGTVMSLSALAVSGAALWTSRSEAVRHAYDTSQNVTEVLVSEIGRTVEIANSSLVNLELDLENPETQNLNPKLRHNLLFERTAAKYVTGMGVTNRYGTVIDGCCGSSHQWNFSDRDYFKVHRDSRNIGLYVSEPYRARSRGGKESIALTRRINGLDGTFGGVAIVAIDLEYFYHLLASLKVGQRGVSAIVRTDGAVLARNPPLGASQMDLLRSSKSFKKMVDQESGAFSAHSSIDGTVRLYTFERIPGTPLIAVVAPAMDDVLYTANRIAWIVGVSASVISVLFSSVVWLLAFALRDKLRKQQLLSDLVQTDALTGLRNRRALDAALVTEWGRMQRNGTGSLSILFVDADNFKQYNDNHGHAQGDTALRFLAARIQGCTQRHADIVARYGGEEFVVVLPDTDEKGAAHVAETIRGDIERNTFAGDGIRIPPFTVSIGYATGTKLYPASIEDLTKHADMALYTAKSKGRNQVYGSLHV